MHIKKNLAIAAAVAVLAVPALGATASANSYNVHPTKNFKVYSTTGKLEPFYLHAGENYKSLGGVGSVKHIALPGHNGQYLLYTGDATGHGAQYADPKDYARKSNINVNPTPTKDHQTTITTTNTQNDKLAQSGESNTGVQNGKLAQTDESNTGAKAGIVGAIAAMVSVTFAGVEKFFKRA